MPRWICELRYDFGSQTNTVHSTSIAVISHRRSRSSILRKLQLNAAQVLSSAVSQSASLHCDKSKEAPLTDREEEHGSQRTSVSSGVNVEDDTLRLPTEKWHPSRQWEVSSCCDLAQMAVKNHIGAVTLSSRCLLLLTAQELRQLMRASCFHSLKWANRNLQWMMTKNNFTSFDIVASYVPPATMLQQRASLRIGRLFARLFREKTWQLGTDSVCFWICCRLAHQLKRHVSKEKITWRLPSCSLGSHPRNCTTNYWVSFLPVS